MIINFSKRKYTLLWLWFITDYFVFFKIKLLWRVRVVKAHAEIWISNPKSANSNTSVTNGSPIASTLTSTHVAVLP